MINQLKTVILLALLTALLLFVGQLLGGYNGLIIAAIIAIVMNFVSYWFSDSIVLKIYRAKPAPENHVLTKKVREVASLAGIPAPKAYIIPSKSPNAFATGRNPEHAAVAATEGIIELLSENELKGVIAHEISHVKNRDTLIQSVTATIAGIIGFVAAMARWSAIFGGFGGRDDNNNIVSLILLAIITPIVATIIQLAISRSREYLADQTAAKVTQKPMYLANALEKLDQNIKVNPMRFGSRESAHLFIANPFTAKGLFALFSTHPPMKERIKRLKAMAY